MNTDLIEFATRVQEDISTGLDSAPEGGAYHAEMLTTLFIDQLTDDLRNAPFEDGEVAHYQNARMRVSGYSLSDAGDRLDLFVTIQRGVIPPEYIPPVEVQRAFRQLGRFLERALSAENPLHLNMESAMPGYDMALRIHENREYLSHVQMHLFTDGLVRDHRPEDVNIGTFMVKRHVWDIQQLQRHHAHRQQPRTIIIDLQEMFGQYIPCLEMPGSGQDYDACLAIIPGNVVARIYAEHGMRLLERNVRAFLQARGGVNKGIRHTILKEPGRFLAYNNGISATASKVEYVTLSNGRRAISRIHDLQIVNGGQTTASLHRAMVRDRADLGQVHVQAKITIVDQQRMMEMVPLISRYANSQNKIEEADLAANDSFHVALEQESKRVWTPALAGVTQSHWFYERARGQYQDAESGMTTTARKKAFRKENPKNQKITKVDVARFIDIWDGMPDVVSRGNQKNFAYFTLRLSNIGAVDVNRELFQRLVAIAILSREASKMARAYPAYKVNIVTYTLAWIVNRTEQRLDLDRIWREQAVPQGLLDIMQAVMKQIQNEINTRPAGANVTEWCKKPVAWEEIMKLSIPATDSLSNFLTNQPIVLLQALPREENPAANILDDDDAEGNTGPEQHLSTTPLEDIYPEQKASPD
ncbi:AIPR family protein [Deinococcus sp. Marseille-Q6407]|uniref:AIPR family protein n=1 Tax=Deinococcus sp. Marseille-Q6407 TaxID=2969223 RepID=UPI0021C21FBE|nr:AIPR family protein [Deinococcus sp. Marseille-Q6407]